jgi:PKD repeat protein
MTGIIAIYQKDEEWDLVPKDLPFINVIPQTLYFGITGMSEDFNYYNWDFGDGNGSSQKFPVHTYTTYGHHKVKVSVKNFGETWMSLEEGETDVILGKIDIEAHPINGDKPLPVHFKNLSISPTGTQFTGWQWDYGDTYGATGISDKLHNYVDYGSFTVGLSSILREDL